METNLIKRRRIKMLNVNVKTIKTVGSVVFAAAMAVAEVLDKQADKKAFDELVKRVAELEKNK